MKKTVMLFPRLANAMLCLATANALAQAPVYPPAEQEPLHVVRYRSAAFLIYTNHLDPGVWTQFHSHGNDLLAMIAGDATAAAQTPDNPVRSQRAPAGTAAFFPYADSPAPYVHRVSAEGDKPFLNVGLEFRETPSGQCDKVPSWTDPAVTVTNTTRRGTAYRLMLPPGATHDLPAQGRALLIVPLPAPDAVATLSIAGTAWQAMTGDFRFYDATANMPASTRPTSVENTGEATLALSIFVAC